MRMTHTFQQLLDLQACTSTTFGVTGDEWKQETLAWTAA